MIRDFSGDQSRIAVILLFLTALGVALLSGSLLGLAVLGWIVLACFYYWDYKYALYSIFFFASFFHPSGFFPDLFFTLKHFHIAVLLLIAAQLIRRDLFLALWKGIRLSRVLYPVLGIIMIAAVSGFYRQMAWGTIRMTGNFLCVVISIVYLRGVFEGREATVRNAVPFFILGVAVQLAANFYNYLAEQYLFELDLFYNNQFATLMVFALLYALVMVVICRKTVSRWFFILISNFFVLGLMFSCSRTAWLGFFIGFLIFCFSVWRYAVRRAISRIFLYRLLLVACLAVVVFALSVNNYYIFYRVKHLLQLLDFQYWLYTVRDHQNFGFLGILRLSQIRDLWVLVQGHLVFGLGFIKQTTDFHGFYFTLLGASGVAGISLFVFFGWLVISSLARAIFMCRKPREYILQVGVCSAVMVWLLSLVTQTMFVHFSVWINVLIAMVLMGRKEV